MRGADNLDDSAGEGAGLGILEDGTRAERRIDDAERKEEEEK